MCNGSYVPHHITSKTFCILPTYVFTCFVWLSSQSVFISLYSIIRLTFVMKTDCVFYAGWIEYFNIRLKSFKFWNNKYIKIGYIFQYFYEENSTKTVIPAHTGLYCIKTVRPAHTGLYCIKTVIPAHTGLYCIKYNLIIIQFRDNGYWVSFPGVKRPGRGLKHPPPSSARVKERVELYLYFPSGASWPVLREKFTFYNAGSGDSLSLAVDVAAVAVFLCRNGYR
jgi:hypothetical protein